MLNYVSVPADAIMALRGKRSALAVLLALLLHRNVRTKRTQFMAVSKIATLSGIGRSSAYRSIQTLIDMGLIEHVAERRGEHMYYLLILDAPVEASTDETEEAYDDVEEAFEAIFTRREGSA